MTTHENKTDSPPVLLLTLLGLASIALAEVFHQKIEPKFVPDLGLLTTGEFATSYKANREKAKTGDARAAAFIQAANRRLREIHDRMVLQESDTDRRFFQELATKGVTENDYMR